MGAEEYKLLEVAKTRFKIPVQPTANLSNFQYIPNPQEGVRLLFAHIVDSQ